MVDLSGHVNPEFGLLHYCIILKTHDKDIFFALPTTSKAKDDKFISRIPEDGSSCLLKHARPISIRRIVGPLLDAENNHVIMSTEHLNILINDYKQFIYVICTKSLWSNKDSLKNIKNKKSIAS